MECTVQQNHGGQPGPASTEHLGSASTSTASAGSASTGPAFPGHTSAGDTSEGSASGGSTPAAGVSAEQAFLQQFARLKRVVAGMGLGPADAEDVLQDVFVEASRRTAGFADSEAATCWLARVTLNRALLEHRRRQRRTRAVTELHQRRRATPPPPAAEPDDAARQVEDMHAVREALTGLDESLLSPLVLRYFCDLDATQIGQVLQLPASTVRGRLREGRMILAKRLLERGAS